MRIDQPWGGTWIELLPQQLDAFYRGTCVILKGPAKIVATPQNERQSSDPDHNAMCGEAWLAWAMTCCGVPTSELQVIQWLRARYGEPSVHSGTVAQQLVAYANAHGVQATISTMAPSNVCAQEVPKGNLVGVCVWITSNAVPCSRQASIADEPPNGLGHWIGPSPTILEEDVVTELGATNLILGILDLLDVNLPAGTGNEIATSLVHDPSGAGARVIIHDLPKPVSGGGSVDVAALTKAVEAAIAAKLDS